MAVFRRKRTSAEGPTDTAYEGLRSNALGVTEATIGKAPSDHPDVLGAVIDIPSDGGIASVVGMADGTTSLYTSTGGGTIGAGAHDAVATRTHALLTTLQHLIEIFPADDRIDLPPADLIQITVITPTGRRRASVPAAAFWGQEPSTVSDLIAAIQDVISGIREAKPT
jgi:hypothetical protein